MAVDQTQFPYVQLPVRAQLLLGGAWTDITSYLRQLDDSGVLADIDRGQPDESSGMKPSTCDIKLDNSDGRFSPRNPAGPYFGQLTRNTPFRLEVGIGERRFKLNDSGSQFTTPDSAAISITGDLDLRIEMELRSWAYSWFLINKGFDPSGQGSYALRLNADATLTLSWSTTGSDSLSATSTLPVPSPLLGRKAVRATIDVNNGAAGRTITFYYSSDNTLSGTWVQLGDPVVQAGTTSIFDGTASLGIFCPNAGSIYRAEIRNGIGGSVVANPTASAVAEGVTSFTDAAGRSWSLAGNGDTTYYRRRFIGEVSEWPVTWDPSAALVDVDVQASGVTRRLGQGAQGLGSTYKRALLRNTSNPPTAYWPMEDDSLSSSIASPVGSNPGRWSGTLNLAGYDGFPGSDPIPTLGSAVVTLQPAGTGIVLNQQVRWFMHVPSGGAANGAVILQYTYGDLLWQVIYGTGGTLQLRVRQTVAGVDTVIADTGAVAFGVDGRNLYCSVEMQWAGSNISSKIVTLEVGVGALLQTLNVIGVNSSNVRTIALNPNQTLTDVAIGHVSVQNQVTALTDSLDALAAYDGEAAGTRISRLCTEEGVYFFGVGNLADTIVMGPQGSGTLLDLINQCVQADGGLLVEHRDTGLPALGYRPLPSLYRQPATVAVTYGQPYGLTDLDPIDDDQLLRNDITVARDSGSSYRATKDTGALSVAEVGRYDDSVSLNLYSDAQTPAVAGWRLAKGTYDDARWPRMCFDLSRAGEADTTKLAALWGLDVGGRVTVDGLPSFLPPGPAATLMTAFRETIGWWLWDLELTGIPAGPYDIGRATSAAAPGTGQNGGKAQAVGSVTAGAFTSGTSTSLSVTVTTAWTTTASQFPFDIMVSGARLRVTAISGSAPTQTFTISTTVVNGVAKSIPVGSAVLLADPARAAL